MPVGPLASAASINTQTFATLAFPGALSSTATINTRATARLSTRWALRGTAIITVSSQATLSGASAAALAVVAQTLMARQRTSVMPAGAPMVDPQTGLVTPAWYQWLRSIVQPLS